MTPEELARQTIEHLIAQVEILTRERDAEWRRGDTYRQRALALRRQAKVWRILTNIESTCIRREVSRLKRELVNEIDYLKKWR